MESPRATVMIGTWNDADVLPRAIESVLAQTLAPLEVGGYDGRYRYAMDYDLWLKIAERHEVWTIDEVLAVRSMRGTNFGAGNERPMMREMLSLQAAALRRRRSLRGVEGLAIPA